MLRDPIIVAIDTADAVEAVTLAEALRGQVATLKVGLTLFYAEGPAIVGRLRGMGFDLFVDLKLHDIPHQVEGAAHELARLGASMITVHASGGSAMVRAAVEGAGRAAVEHDVPRPKVIAVTVLTSLDAAALAETGVMSSPDDQVGRLARLSAAAGADGVVCSPNEAAALRALLGSDALVVTPGVRPAWAAAGDQARIATPADALAAGASHLVIGRPITGSGDPAAALTRIREELSTL